MANKVFQIGFIQAKDVWKSGTAYSAMTRICNADRTVTYIAIQDVPSGKELTDTSYWLRELDIATLVSTLNTSITNANSAAKSATDAAASATAASIPSDYTSGISEGIAHDEGDADSNRDNYNSDEIGDAHATTLTIDEPYKVCGQSSILTGTSAPTSIIPDFTGQIYIDIANGNAYIAVYNSTSTNWVKIN